MVNIIGSGLSGLSCALRLAGQGQSCRLISNQPSYRAQSVLAEGGINAVLDTMGEADTIEEHYTDTMRGGAFLADEEAVRGLVTQAPRIIEWLSSLGVPFQMENGRILLRNFGGQKKKRTAFVKSSTGKALTNALIDATRRYEQEERILRYQNHSFINLFLKDGVCKGAFIQNDYTGATELLYGPVVLAVGGLSGFFPKHVTGSAANTGDAAAAVFAQGVRFSNLEMLQYHPTTIPTPFKRILVSEAARGEGGRLFSINPVSGDKERCYFMEEKYPELKNLMPRDVVSREIYDRIMNRGEEVFLDMTEISEKVWNEKLSDLRDGILLYAGKDPMKEPVSVSPGIHYFMGGIDVDPGHRTNIPGLYAAGECAGIYHGANRLGGNSLLGAIYGGRRAAETILEEESAFSGNHNDIETFRPMNRAGSEEKESQAGDRMVAEIRTRQREESDSISGISQFDTTLCQILLSGLGIVRTEEGISAALDRLKELSLKALTEREKNRIHLAEAMLRSALWRKESRGAHYRADHPESREEFRRPSRALFQEGGVVIE
ncbi:MAG: FAD-binding protein [Lachnospiraceae bacterium]|nr:FAD-binding protein [Lachnospiraceae bacterium]